jgi:hypothetical protein
LVERVQVTEGRRPGRPSQPGASRPIGTLRYATAALGVIYTGFVFAYLGDPWNWRINIVIWWFAARAVVTVTPLLTRGIRAFRLACRIEAVIVFLIGVWFCFFGAFLLFPALLPLIVAAAKSPRADTVAAPALAAVALACFAAAILTSA